MVNILDSLSICQTEYWHINHRIDSVLPGYFILGSVWAIGDPILVPSAGLEQLGPLLAKSSGR